MCMAFMPRREDGTMSFSKLSPMDMLGMLYYDWNGGNDHKWHIPFQTVGGKKYPNTDLYIKLGVEDVATVKTVTLEIPLHPAGAK